MWINWSNLMEWGWECYLSTTLADSRTSIIRPWRKIWNHYWQYWHLNSMWNCWGCLHWIWLSVRCRVVRLRITQISTMMSVTIWVPRSIVVCRRRNNPICHIHWHLNYWNSYCRSLISNSSGILRVRYHLVVLMIGMYSNSRECTIQHWYLQYIHHGQWMNKWKWRCYYSVGIIWMFVLRGNPRSYSVYYTITCIMYSTMWI